MGALADFVKSEAEHLRTEAGRREEALQDWLRAIDRLNQTLTQWVLEADNGHRLLQVQPTGRITRQEALLGVYEVRGLSIGFGGRFSATLADILPRARYVSAVIQPVGESRRRADGIVDMGGGVSTSYLLFRLAEPGGDRWFIRGVEDWNADPSSAGRVEPLDPERFESALLSVLR